MAEPFKNLINPKVVATLASWFREAGPFDEAAFEAAANDGLDALELKPRVKHVSEALRGALDPDWPTALQHTLKALPPPLEETQDVTGQIGVWPICQLVEDHGLLHPELSVPALREITRRFSAEFAIRAYIEQDPAAVIEQLHEWAQDPDVHVRRLVSEGSRPRLPWGRRLNCFVEEPTPTLALLDKLVDDPEEYVRRSVANHLNDIAKDNPEVAVATAARWLESPSKERSKAVNHAMRGLVKEGHPGALALLGYGSPEVELLGLACEPAAASIGGKVTIRVMLRSTAAAGQNLMVDYTVYSPAARSGFNRKVFKGRKKKLGPGKILELTLNHPLKKVSTRKTRAGIHEVELTANGVALGKTSFDLKEP